MKVSNGLLNGKRIQLMILVCNSVLMYMIFHYVVEVKFQSPFEKGSLAWQVHMHALYILINFLIDMGSSPNNT